MGPELQERLAENQIQFQFNPPAAPHFGGAWEREIQSVKRALQVVIGTQPLHDDVLLTFLIKVEGILNEKPLGYVSSDLADPDPVTPNMLLLGPCCGTKKYIFGPDYYQGYEKSTLEGTTPLTNHCTLMQCSL